LEGIGPGPVEDVLTETVVLAVARCGGREAAVGGAQQEVGRHPARLATDAAARLERREPGMAHEHGSRLVAVDEGVRLAWVDPGHGPAGLRAIIPGAHSGFRSWRLALIHDGPGGPEPLPAPGGGEQGRTWGQFTLRGSGGQARGSYRISDTPCESHQPN